MKKNLIWQMLLGLVISVGLIAYLIITGYTPVGNDIFGHLYKAEVLYDNILEMNFYPLYTTDWYNGIQLFRYWPIFTYYVIAFIMLFTKDVTLAYYVYIGFSFLLGYIGWVMIGNREKKPIFVAIGIIYFFLPDNIRILFMEGNLSRVMIMALLPLFMYFYTNLIENKKNFIATSLMVALITATHFMLAAMCAIIFVIYGFFRGLKNNTQLYGFYSFVSGLLIAGILLLPGLSGGIVSDSSSAAVDTIADWSQPLIKSLSIFTRMQTNNSFGLGMAILAIITFILAKKTSQARSGIVIGLIFFILSDSIFTGIFKQLPMSQVFWMARFVQMCYVLILYDFGIMEIDKKMIKYVVMAVVVLDIIPSLPYFALENDLEKQKNEYLLDEAAAITDNRLAIVDESLFGPYPSYYVLENKIPYMQGWAIQGATISENIITATEALKKGYYSYTFDQLVNMGTDAVIINRGFISDQDEMLRVASEYNYQYVNQTDSALLLDMTDVEGTFGVVSQYKHITIGSSGKYISYLYPTFKQGESDNLLDYTFEELSQYEKVYLSNVEYEDVEKAEELIRQLDEAGVQVYIDATHMPINVLSIAEFLGVESRFVSIYNLQKLQYKDKEINIGLPYEWYTTYLLPVEEGYETASYQYGSQNLQYLAKKGNITFIGFNLLYLYIEEENEELLNLLNEIFDISEEDYIVDEKIVPITIGYDRNRIKIMASEKVNTTLAFQDNFVSESEFIKDNNLLVVHEGITSIKIVYKHFWIGLICSLMGYAMMLVAYWKLDLR